MDRVTHTLFEETLESPSYTNKDSLKGFLKVLKVTGCQDARHVTKTLARRYWFNGK